MRLGRVVASLVVAAAAGCGSSDAPSIAPVSGTVTVKGEPRGDLNVVFFPESGGRPASGKTAADGTFTLTTLNTNDGAPIGTCKVAISGAGVAKDWGPDGPPYPDSPKYAAYKKELAAQVDPKYSTPENSGLVYTVPEEGLPNLEIKLP